MMYALRKPYSTLGGIMNYELFQVINNLAGISPILDQFMIYIVKFSAPIMAILVATLLGLGLYTKDKELTMNSIHTILLLGITLAIDQVIGFFYVEPRPFVSHTVNLLLVHSADPSFPSTHAMGMSAIALSLFAVYKRLGSILIALTLLTGFAKIFVGHHYPIDIIGGFIITYVLFLLYNKLLKQRITPYISNLKHMQRHLSTIFKRSSVLIIESQRPLTKRFTK